MIWLKRQLSPSSHPTDAVAPEDAQLVMQKFYNYIEHFSQGKDRYNLIKNYLYEANSLMGQKQLNTQFTRLDVPPVEPIDAGIEAAAAEASSKAADSPDATATDASSSDAGHGAESARSLSDHGR